MALIIKNPGDYSRSDINLGSVAAGSGGITSKFVAFANVLLFGLTTYTVTLGSSTYTQTVNGTATGTGTASGQQLSVIVVTNTSTTTATVAMSTATIGPFLAGGLGTAAQVGGSNQWAINTNTGTTGYGGYYVPEGSLVYVVSGTDATAVTAATIDYQLAFGAPVVA
jgi:hypothetical protein